MRDQRARFIQLRRKTNANGAETELIIGPEAGRLMLLAGVTIATIWLVAHAQQPDSLLLVVWETLAAAARAR